MSLIIADTIEIDASPEEVWQFLGDLSTWPHWNRTCRKAEFVSGEPWTPNSCFTMTMHLGPIPLTATVEINEMQAGSPRAVSWRGGRLGVHSDHRWKLESLDSNRTRILSHEVFTGATLPLLRLGGLRPLVGYLSRAWLHGLKRAAERSRKPSREGSE